jgi:serpin B
MSLPRLSLSLLAVVTLGACSSGPEATVLRGEVIKLPAAEARTFTEADTAFGLKLLDTWCEADPQSNLVFSPTSLSNGLGMAYLGAKGETAEGMAKALAYPAGSPEQTLAGLRARLQAMSDVSRKKATVKVTDQVWADKNLPPNKDYLDRVRTAYDAGLKTLPLLDDPEGSRKTINDSISKNTDGLIKDLIPKDVLGRIGWVLTDAVHLKADWRVQFERGDTKAAPFATAAGRTMQPQFLNSDGDRFAYAHQNGWTSVTLPYEGGRLSMVALLPDGSGTGCPDLDPAKVSALAKASKPVTVSFSMPKVDLSTHTEMKDLLPKLGMDQAFSDSADFTGLSPDAWKIAAVQHAATLRVDEKGTDAAAATSVEMEAVSAPLIQEKVVFNKPYVLMIRDDKTGQPLFIARVADPTVTGRP